MRPEMHGKTIQQGVPVHSLAPIRHIENVTRPEQPQATSAPVARQPRVGRVYITGTIVNDGSGTSGVSPSDVRRQLDRLGKIDELHVLIDSEGGKTRAMTAIMEMFQNHPAPIKVGHCTGKAYSAAGALLMIFLDRRMTPNACLMLHNVWHGDAKNPNDTEESCELMSEAILDLWHERAYDVPKEVIREWRNACTYIDRKTARNLGFCTDDSTEFETSTMDITGCRQPFSPCDYPHTKRFESRKATARTNPKPSSEKSKLNQDWPAGWTELDEMDYRANATLLHGGPPKLISIPPMSDRLRTSSLVCRADLNGTLDFLAEPQNAKGDPMQQGLYQQQTRLAVAGLRFQKEAIREQRRSLMMSQSDVFQAAKMRTIAAIVGEGGSIASYFPPKNEATEFDMMAMREAEHVATEIQNQLNQLDRESARRK